LWELIPYSFLVDYFTNIGDILTSWSYRFIGLDWASQTVRRVGSRETANQRLTFDPSFVNSHNRGAYTISPGSTLFRKTSFVRTPSVTLGVPSLELQVPGRWSQWVNILALGLGLDSARKALAR
jgi:hypothetical protein